ncbi:MAG: SRPBCC family protein [bacterium]
MGCTKNSIIIQSEIDKVFNITNDIERWPLLFDESQSTRILSRNGKEVTFEMTNKKGQTWCSKRIIDKENYRAIAQRGEPTFPYKFMNIEWLYEKVSNGTKMICIQEFEMAPEAGVTDGEMEAKINNHVVTNLQKIKAKIESGVLTD